MAVWVLLAVTVLCGAVTGAQQCSRTESHHNGCTITTVTHSLPYICQYLLIPVSHYNFYFRPEGDINLLIVVGRQTSRNPQSWIVFNIDKNTTDISHKWYKISLEDEIQILGRERLLISVYVDNNLHKNWAIPFLSNLQYSVLVKGTVSFAPYSTECIHLPPPYSWSSISPSSTAYHHSVSVSPFVSLSTTTSASTNTENEELPMKRNLNKTTIHAAHCSSAGYTTVLWHPWDKVVLAIAVASVAITVIAMVMMRRNLNIVKNQETGSDIKTSNQPRDVKHSNLNHHSSAEELDAEHVYEEVEKRDWSRERQAGRESVRMSINSIYVPFEMTK